jgi:hypothetical protein
MNRWRRYRLYDRFWGFGFGAKGTHDWWLQIGRWVWTTEEE